MSSRARGHLEQVLRLHAPLLSVMASSTFTFAALLSLHVEEIASASLPSFSGAMAIGFLTVAVTVSVRRYLQLCLAIMGLQVLVGLVGFALHL